MLCLKLMRFYFVVVVLVEAGFTSEVVSFFRDLCLLTCQRVEDGELQGAATQPPHLGATGPPSFSHWSEWGRVQAAAAAEPPG